MYDYFKTETYTLILLAIGFVAMVAAIIPVLVKKRHISAPVIYLLIGIIGYLFWSGNSYDPADNLDIIKHITEFVVLVALANAGLKIKEPFAWKTWRYSARLLLISMPLTIIAAAYAGWYIAGLAPATAILFGALISPTDPVLAAELQTSGPTKEDNSTIKLALTSEAGINDGLAFPFTYFAIMLVQESMDYTQWIGKWLLHDFVIQVAIAIAVGLFTGWALSKVVFSIRSKDALSKVSRGIISLSLILLPYAICEMIGGYGFVAVFIGACIFSKYEEYEEHVDNLHEFNEELESFVVAVIFITMGIFIDVHYKMFLDAQVVLTALAVIFIIRPLTGYVSLINTKLIPFQKYVLSFYGIRGIGSIYYLAYALTAASFANEDKLIDITMITIFISVIVHGLTGKTIQNKIKEYNPKATE